MVDKLAFPYYIGYMVEISDRDLQKLSDDVMTILADQPMERATISDVIDTLRGSRFAGLGTAGIGRWSFTNNYAAERCIERAGFVIFTSANERNQRARYVGLKEVHLPKAEAPKFGFVILGNRVAARHNRSYRTTYVTGLNGTGRRYSDDLADAKVYKTRSGAEKAAAKLAARSLYRQEDKDAFNASEAVLDVASLCERDPRSR